MSLLQDLIPETIPGQKCYMNVDAILNGYEYVGIWSVVWFGNYLFV